MRKEEKGHKFHKSGGKNGGLPQEHRELDMRSDPCAGGRYGTGNDAKNALNKAEGLASYLKKNRA